MNGHPEDHLPALSIRSNVKVVGLLKGMAVVGDDDDGGGGDGDSHSMLLDVEVVGHDASCDACSIR
eukprot:scaffold10201_cov119-Cylindrotheca_fusiformis.AAC.5